MTALAKFVGYATGFLSVLTTSNLTAAHQMAHLAYAKHRLDEERHVHALHDTWSFKDKVHATPFCPAMDEAHALTP